MRTASAATKLKRILVGLGATAAFVSAAPLFAQVDNGSFESPVVNGNFETKTGTGIDDWVIGGTVDHIDGYWQAADGAQSVDLNGTTLGSLSQDLSLAPSSGYVLSFYLAENPDGPPDPKSLTVTITDTTLLPQIVTTAGITSTHDDMNWTQFLFPFTTGLSGLYTLTFASTSVGTPTAGCPSGDCWGPALDAVTIMIPEPETYAMVLAGLALLGFAARRRSTVLQRVA